jgi:hypothetical protein
LPFLISSAFAQTTIPKEFPADDQGFVKAYGDYITSTNRTDAKEQAKLLTSILLASTNTYNNISTVKNIANLLLSRKTPLYPTYSNYANFLLISNKAIVSQDFVNKNFTILEDLLKSSRKDALKDFNNYIEYLGAIYLKPNSIYADKNRTWNAYGDFKVKTDSTRPYFEYNKVTLIGITEEDTITIKDISGYYFPLLDMFEGTGGQMDWRRHNLDSNKVYAKLDSIKFFTSKSELIMPNATLTYLPYFEKTFKGNMKDYLSMSKATKPNFPQFITQDITELNNLSKELKLKGRVYLEGSNIFVAGNDTIDASLKILDKTDVPIVIASAPRFMIRDFSEVLSERTFLELKIASDLITHPGLTFNYSTKTRTLKANRDNKAYSRMPFYSTYYKVSMLPDQLLWNIDSSYVEINPISVHLLKPSYFESFSFYKPGIETKYSIGLDFDPLQALASYYFNNQSLEVDVNTVAGMMGRGYSVKQIESILYSLQADGYINYNSLTGKVQIYDKAILHVNAAKKKQDYDVIKFASENKEQVGKIMLNNREMEIYGVKNIEFSNSKNVEVFPTSDTIRLGENRSITLKGRLQAGKVNFYSQKLEFKYDNFIFKMDKIDSMLIMVPIGTGIPGPDGSISLQEISTPLQDISGTLYIDDPDNKSGLKNNKKFPYFDCSDSAFIYYDRGSNIDKYNKDSFYFVVYPFRFDSMNTFDTKALRFDGKLISANIFEDFETQVGIQEDLSLGFTIQAPEKGFALYGKKNKIFDEIHLDNNGLIAHGKIKRPPFEALITKSELYPKLYRSEAEYIDFIEDKVGNTPQGKTAKAKLFWDIQKDSMALIAEENKYNFYNDRIEIKGNINYIKDSLKGLGEATMDKAIFTSNDFKLKANTFESPKSDISIKTPDSKSIAFSINNASFKIDFKNNTGNFSNNEKEVYSKLPFYHYITNANDYDWNIDSNTITFTNKSTTNKKFFFISNDPAKDSLGFSSTLSIYDLNDNTLTAKGVEDVLIADSKLIPKGNVLNLDNTGEISTFDEAKMVFSTLNNYHYLENVHLLITSKNDFKGFGDLIYKVGNVNQKIKVEEIIPDFDEVKDEKYKKSNATIRQYFVKARGVIVEEEKYKLDDRILYRGDVHFNSKSPELLLNGFAKLELPKDSTEWFAIEQKVSTKKAAIDLDSLFNENKQQLQAGIYIDKAAYLHYPSVLNVLHGDNDLAVFKPKGILQNGPEKDVISYGDITTINGTYPYGDIMKYNVITGNIEATGKLELAYNLKEYCTLFNFGNIKYKSVDSLMQFTSLFSLDFFMDEGSKDILSKSFVENNATAVTAPFAKNTLFQKGFYNLIKDKVQGADAIVKDMSGQGIFSLPPAFPFNLVLSDVKWIWDSEEGTFKAIDKVGVMVLGNKAIGLKAQAYLEVAPRLDGKDFVNVYLVAANGVWYYFRYIDGVMSVQSSDEAFMNQFRSIDIDKKQIKKGKSTIVYEIMEPSANLKDNFVNRIEEFKDRIKN